MWPDKWRQQMAGEDPKLLERLQRFTSPKDILTSYRALEQRMSSGELKNATPFPKEGTPEQQRQWRQENGLPEKADGYDLKFDNGLVLGAEDKPWINSYLQAAHAANMSPAHVKETLQWYANWKDSQADVREQADQDVARKTVDALRAEWQGDYRTNMNGIEALLATAPKGVGDRIKNSRGPDGNPLMSDPDTLRFLAHLFRQILPVTTMSTGAPADEKGIDSEIAQIKEVMTTNRKKYNTDEKMQERYRELLKAKDRMAQRR